MAQSEQTFRLNGADLTLAEATPEVAVYFQSMRLNRALNVWNVELTVSNISQRVLAGPLVLLVDGFANTTGPQLVDGRITGGKGFYDLSALAPGSSLAPRQGTVKRTLTLGMSTGSPTLATKFYVARPTVAAALGVTRSLNAAGQPLPGVALSISGPAGTDAQLSDAPSGVVSFGQGPGEHIVKFSTDGYLPVWRKQSLSLDKTTVLPNPRLTQRSLNAFNVSPLGGTIVSNAADTITINLSAGAVSQNTILTLTPLTGQSLPAFLPPGWSPLSAFWLESDAPLNQSLTASLLPAGTISANETAALVRWDDTALQWLVTQMLPGNGTNRVTVSLPGTGAYALVAGDLGDTAPPTAHTGQPLSGFVPAPVDAAQLTARGSVTPPSSPASVIPEFVTGLANLEVRHPDIQLPSGYLLRGEVTEAYLLGDGSLRLTPQYEHFIIGYQRPGDQDPFTLHSTFPMRPVLLFGTDQLEEATVRVDVLPEQAFDGRVLDAEGGQISDGAVRILAGSGRITGPSALRLRRLDATVFTNLMAAGHEVLGAFDLTVDRSTVGQPLTPQLSGAPNNSLFVLARLLSEVGFYGLQPIERLASDAQGNLTSLEPETGERLPGLRGSGQFVLLQVSVAQGLISGIARDGQGQLQAAMPVRITGLPWLTLTDEQGRYQLLAPAGDVEIGVTDPRNGDTGFANFNNPDPQNPFAQDLATAPAGPRVASITPTDNATKVPRVLSVVIRFNEAVNPGSIIGGAIQLLAPGDVIVPAALSLNLKNTIATLSPANELAANTAYRVRLAGTIADPGGLPLEGQTEFSFTTLPLSTRVATAQLVIYEPGATNVPSAILDDIPAFTPGEDPFAIVVHGQPGVADPDVPVILVNESTGETQTVLSKLDGSFSSFINGTEEDFVSATFVNLNGTRVYVPVSRQEFDDGFVGLYPQGGILEAQSDGGPVQVLVEPGAIATKTKVQIEAIDLGRLTQALGTLPADGALLLGGFSMAVEGDDLSVGADVSFPVNPADLRLPPGVAPEDASFALTIPQELDDGTVAYEIIDQMHYEDGKLVTHSPPFSGVLLRQILKNMQSTKKLKLSNKILHALGLPGIQETVIHQLMLPIMMAAGSSVRVAGQVRAAKFNDEGDVVPGTLRFVPGATVTYHHQGIQGRPGHIRPGTTFATAGDDGKFAFLMPADLVTSAVAINLVATHPEFFPQSAAGGAAIANLAAAALQPVQFVPLYFQLVTGDVDLGDDQVPPQIYFSQSPRDPPPGTNDVDGATITVSARDDREVSSLTLLIEDYQPLNPTVTNAPPTPIIEDETEVTFGTVLRQKTFRLRSPIRASLVVKASANDSAGNLREARFPVVFAGDRIYPDPTGSAPGPRLLSSWPPDGATAVQPGEPLLLRFSEPVKAGAENDAATWLTMVGARLSSLQFSADRKVATVHFAAAPGSDLTFTLLPALTGANDKPFDQDPAIDGDQSHTLVMAMVPALGGALPGIELGGGVVTAGAFAYALERLGNLDGSVVVFDLSGDQPVKISEASVPGFPRDLVFIPNYSYRLKENGACKTGNLLAVVGGVIGGEGFQYLWIFDVTNPAEPVRLAATPVAIGGVALTKVQWSPPFIAYLESGADVTSVALVNLQTFVLGMNATLSEISSFPAEGRVGSDVNKDGDYCDDGDEVPLPIQAPSEFFGKDFTLTVNTVQRIQDFDFNADEGLVGLTVAQGYKRAANGLADTNSVALPAYRTAFSGLGRPDPDLATVEFAAGDRPKRVAVMTSVLLRAPDGSESRRNLAIVSVNKASGANSLVVIDISAVEAPVVLAELDVSEFGIPQTLMRRSDGLLALATSTDVLLLDPARFLLPAQPDGSIASLAGRLPGLGSGIRAFAAPDTGINVVNAGGQSRVSNTGPKISIVNFPNFAPVAANQLVLASGETKQAMLQDAVVQSTLIKERLFSAGTSQIPPQLQTPTPGGHYYVRVDAVGGPGQGVIDLNLEVLNNAGFPLSVGGANAVPARLGADATLAAIGQTNQPGVHPRRLRAYRLSIQPSDPFETVYLAGPFVLVDTTLATNQAMAVQAQLSRNIVRAGRFLWVGIDPVSWSATLQPGFLSKTSGQRLLPGVSAQASIIHDERPLVLIHGIAGSHLENTNSWTSFLISERWPGYLSLIQKELNLNPDEPQFPIAASDIIRQIPEDYNAGPGGIILPLLGVQKGVYQPLIHYLTNELGYLEYNYIKKPGEIFASAQNFAPRRTIDGMVPEEIPRGPNLFVFPYDWRLDNARNAEHLREYLKVIQAVHPGAEKIDIVAHSMGGLVARRFILDNPGVVDKCITIGTPFLGAPKAISALETGDFDDAALNIIIAKPLLKKMGEYYPAVHQLLPSKAYFDLGGRPLGEAGWDFDGDGGAGEKYDYENYKFVLDSVFHTKTNTWPVATNEVFHSYSSPADAANRQDDWSQDATGIEYFHIYGVQSVPNTIGEVRLSRTLRPVVPPPDLRLGLPYLQSTEGDVDLPLSAPLLSEDTFVMYPRFDLVRVPGDGTVTELSASRVGAGGNFNAPGARLLKVKSDSLEHDEGANHNGMLANQQVHEWVGEILRGGEPQAAPLFSAQADPAVAFVHVEIVNALPGSAYAIENSTGRNSKGSDIAGTAGSFTDVVKVVPALAGFADGDKNVQAVEFSIAGSGAYSLVFEATEQPVSIIIRSGTGSDVTAKVIHRDVQYSSGTVVTIQVPGGGGTPTISPAGNASSAPVTLSGAAANNEQNPVMAHELDLESNQVTLMPSDDVTTADQLPIFGAYDDGNDRDIDSELIQRLPQPRVAVDSLESSRFFSLTMDDTGNLSEPRPLKRQTPASIDCDLLEAKRNAILDVIEQGLEGAMNDGWLLDYQHVSILEQGSGTCLWVVNSCPTCAEVYSPKESDHDYEVFLKVFVNGVPGNFTANPHSQVNREGDWYFRPPVQVGNQWEYTRPDGSMLHRPATAKRETPGQLITRLLNDSVKLLGYDKPDPVLPINYPLLPDVSFFPVRYDHFTNAVLDLELPPEDGDDPIGDAGLGRQMLLLKWVLEGVYVPVVNPPIDPGYDLDAIFALMKSRGDSGIQPLEGFEWGQLQLHAALGSGLMLRVNNPSEPTDPDQVNRDFLYELTRKQIKKAGKAAIRASLAQIAGSDEPDRADLLFSVDRQLMASLNLQSFEEVIAFLAAQKPDLFGPYASRLNDFVSAKLARQDFIDELVVDDCKLNQFLADCMNLLFKVNQDTRPNWDQAVILLPSDEEFFRTNNLQKIRDGFPSVNRPGLNEYLNLAAVTLPVRLINDSDQALSGVTATMTVAGATVATVVTNIPARTFDAEGNVVAGYVDFKKGPFTLTRSLTAGTPQAVLLTVTAPALADEVRIGNNWLGLESHILDLTDACNVPPLQIPDPSGLSPANPEAARLFRRNDFFDPGFDAAKLAQKFATHFGQPPQRIYVVGSQMLGAADANSDIDVIFVTDVINPDTQVRLSKADDAVLPFFAATNPHLTIPANAKRLGNTAIDPEAIDIGKPEEVADPDQKARTMPKRGVIDPFFETIYEVNRFGFLVWPQ